MCGAKRQGRLRLKGPNLKFYSRCRVEIDSPLLIFKLTIWRRFFFLVYYCFNKNNKKEEEDKSKTGERLRIPRECGIGNVI